MEEDNGALEISKENNLTCIDSINKTILNMSTVQNEYNETRMIPYNSEFHAYALIRHWRVRKHKTQSYRESCMFHFSHFELYFALHSCVEHFPTAFATISHN